MPKFIQFAESILAEFQVHVLFNIQLVNFISMQYVCWHATKMKLLKFNICYIQSQFYLNTWHEYLCGFIGKKNEQVEILTKFSQLPNKWSCVSAKDIYSCCLCCCTSTMALPGPGICMLKKSSSSPVLGGSHLFCMWELCHSVSTSFFPWRKAMT